MQQPKAYTVTAITRLIKSTLEESFQGLWVEGEISGYIHHSSGHRYLTLKDNNAVLKVTIWKFVGQTLKFEPKNGQKVLIYGDINVYEKGGNYQLNCKKILPVGIGELELAFRQLYEKLSEEGLFDDDRKKPIPTYAYKIGIVTSPTGAAIRDIIQIARRRNPSVELILFPATVQGDGGEDTIAAGIEYFNSRDDIDIIITGRGGGSLEDLWNFNTEKVVRAIVASLIPIISAVGHEIDTTLADYAADLRAPTPSAAAELAVWSLKDLQEQLYYHATAQTTALQYVIEYAQEHLSRIISRPVFKHPFQIIEQRQQYLDSCWRQLQITGKNRFESHKNRLSLAASRLDTLSPLKILSRGYSVSRFETDGKLIKSAASVKVGDRIETIVADGSIISEAAQVAKRTIT